MNTLAITGQKIYLLSKFDYLEPYPHVECAFADVERAEDYVTALCDNEMPRSIEKSNTTILIKFKGYQYEIEEMELL